MFKEYVSEYKNFIRFMKRELTEIDYKIAAPNESTSNIITYLISNSGIKILLMVKNK